MPSTPTEKFEANLNGTGVLIDITAWVSRTDRIEHQWGRSDWTSRSPRPGTLRFTLDNRDGRFTPGNTAFYSSGVAVGCVVRWTVGSRVRQFVMGTPEIVFRSGVAGSSTVTVSCYDSLQTLAVKSLRSLFDETIMSRDAYLHWPLSEVVPGGSTPSQVIARDIAAVSDLRAGSTMTPVSGDVAGPASDASLGWGQGTGPGTDGRSALVMWPGVTTPPALGDLYLQTGTFAFNDSNESGEVFDSKKPAALAGSVFAGHYSAFGLSMWVNISSTAGYPAFVSGSDTGTVYVLLAAVGGFVILWRPRANSISVARIISGSWVVTHGLNQGVAPGATTHIAVAMFDGSTRACEVTINGAPQGLSSHASTFYAGPPKGVAIGGLGPSLVTMSYTAMYGLAGTVSNVSLHGSPGVYRTTTANGWWPNARALWEAGKGLSELAPARFARLMDLLGDTALANSVTGQEAPYVLGNQETAGLSLLDAIGDGLRAEGACLDAQVIGGVDTIRAWMDGALRLPTPAIILNVQDDCDAPPVISFDTGGVASRVTAVNSAEKVSILWVDRKPSAQFVGVDVAVPCALLGTADALALAKLRGALGRLSGVVPTVVSFNAPTAKASLATAALALRPGMRVRVQGLPAATLGYSQIDCELIGATERYGLGVAQWELRLAPILLPEGWFDPLDGTDGPWRFGCTNGIGDVLLGVGDEPDSSGRVYYVAGWTGTAYSATYSASDTTLTLYHTNTNTDGLGPIGFSTDAADYPLDVKLTNGEIVRFTSAPTVPTAVGAAWYQVATGVQRGQRGTTAQANASSPGAMIQELVNLAPSGRVERTYFTY